MGRDIQFSRNIGDPVAIPVAAQEQIPVITGQAAQKVIQIRGQFSGIVVGFHRGQSGNRPFQFFQRHIVVGVPLLGTVGVISLQGNITRNAG